MEVSPIRSNKADRTIFVFASSLFVVITSAFLLALKDVHGFYAGDMGVKLWQIQAWVDSDWRQASLPFVVPYTGWRKQFTPLVAPFFWSDTAERVYTVYITPFVAISGWLFGRLGHLGLYVLPWLSGVAGLLLLYGLGRSMGFRRSGLAVAILGLASPWLFYSVVFWEHTLAVALVWTGMWIATNRPHLAQFLVLGALLGLALVIRVEVFLFALCWLSCFRKRRSDFRVWMAVGVMTVAVIALNSLFQFRWTGQWLPPQWRANVDDEWGGRNDLWINQPYFSLSRLSDTIRQVLALARSPTFVDRGLAACYIIQLSNSLYLYRRRARFVENLTILMTGVIAALLLLALIQAPMEVSDNLVASFPALLLLPFLAQRTVREKLPPAARSLLMSICAFIILVVLAAPNDGGLQWGPRYLLVTPGLLALVIAELIGQLWEEKIRTWLWRVMVLMTLVVSIVVQVIGIYTLWVHRCDNAAAEIALADEGMVVTNIWYLPQHVMPYTFLTRTVLLVTNETQAAELIRQLRRSSIDRFTYVTFSDVSEPWPEANHRRGALRSLGRPLIPKWLVWMHIAVPFNGVEPGNSKTH